MTQVAHTAAAPATGEDRVVRLVLIVLAVSELALGLLQVFAPGTFYDRIGPFGGQNDHYIRDSATWSLALAGVAFLAVRFPSWRVPVLTFATLQFSFHAINHLVDINEADPKSAGVLDFVSLALGAAGLGWVLRRALAGARR